jgi:uncharacterized protein (DUF2267 family)
MADRSLNILRVSTRRGTSGDGAQQLEQWSCCGNLEGRLRCSVVVPAEYLNATRDFDRFLRDVVDTTGLVTINQAYTTAQGVLRAFRRRLEIVEALRFANALPAGLRALFVAEWEVDEARREFEDIETMTLEVQGLRGLHNWSPETAIHDVAIALRRNVIEAELDAVLETLPNGARAFWA